MKSFFRNLFLVLPGNLNRHTFLHSISRSKRVDLTTILIRIDGNLPEDPEEDVTTGARSPGTGITQPPTAVTEATTPSQHTGALFSLVEQEEASQSEAAAGETHLHDAAKVAYVI